MFIDGINLNDMNISELAELTHYILDTLGNKLRDEHGYGCYVNIHGSIENGSVYLYLTDVTNSSSGKSNYCETFSIQ